MAMKPKAMKRGGAAKKMMRGGMVDKPTAMKPKSMKRGGVVKMMRGGKAKK